MRKLGLILMLSLLLILCTSCTKAPEVVSGGEHHTVATVDYDEQYWEKGLNYARIIELQHSGENNGVLVATHESYTSGLRVEKPGYDIHISRDGGVTWQYVNTVREKAASIQSEWQPHLYELPQPLGDMPAGTLLLAGCSIDSAHAKQTALRLYRSFDLGQTWEQFGTVATGGGLAFGGKKETGVWEPFLLMLPDGRLACYYADCTEAESHSQKVVMRITEDGKDWGETINIVALEKQSLRPGMPVVTQMNDGRFIMVYEMVDAADPHNGNPVYCRFSADGINWGDVTDPGTRIAADKKNAPSSCPYVAYLPNVGEKGLLLLTSAGGSAHRVFYNDNLGDAKSWRVWHQPVEIDADYMYSHAIFPSVDGKTAHFVNCVPDTQSELGYYKMIHLNISFK